MACWLANTWNWEDHTVKRSKSFSPVCDQVVSRRVFCSLKKWQLYHFLYISKSLQGQICLAHPAVQPKHGKFSQSTLPPLRLAHPSPDKSGGVHAGGWLHNAISKDIDIVLFSMQMIMWHVLGFVSCACDWKQSIFTRSGGGAEEARISGKFAWRCMNRRMLKLRTQDPKSSDLNKLRSLSNQAFRNNQVALNESHLIIGCPLSWKKTGMGTAWHQPNMNSWWRSSRGWWTTMQWANCCPLSKPFLQALWQWKTAVKSSGKPNKLLRGFAYICIDVRQEVPSPFTLWPYAPQSPWRGGWWIWHDRPI